MKIIYCFLIFFYQFIRLTLLIFIFSSCTHLNRKKTGNVIFFHPDGMSLAHWDTIRLIAGGPDGLSPLLPEGVAGYFGVDARKDGKNLIQKAKSKGCHAIYTREELRNIPKDIKRVQQS